MRVSVGATNASAAQFRSAAISSSPHTTRQTHDLDTSLPPHFERFRGVLVPPLIADSGRQLLDQIWWDTRADRSCQVACCGFTSVGVLRGRVLESGSCYLDGPVAIGSFKSRLHAPNSLRSKVRKIFWIRSSMALSKHQVESRETPER